MLTAEQAMEKSIANNIQAKLVYQTVQEKIEQKFKEGQVGTKARIVINTSHSVVEETLLVMSYMKLLGYVVTDISTDKEVIYLIQFPTL
jgi:hypothetical protein